MLLALAAIVIVLVLRRRKRNQSTDIKMEDKITDEDRGSINMYPNKAMNSRTYEEMQCLYDKFFYRVKVHVNCYTFLLFSN